jgi:hydrogenase maturation protease
MNGRAHRRLVNARIDLLGPDVPIRSLDLLVIGCGNPLRGDDAAGVVMIRRLSDLGVGIPGTKGPLRWHPPPSSPESPNSVPKTPTYRGVSGTVEVVDAGTSGMDVAFRMRGAKRVILVDAARTGGVAGSLMRLPAVSVADVPEPRKLASHEFRWDHAIAAGRWLLGEYMPSQIEAILIEGASFGWGDPLSLVADAAVDDAATLVAAEIRRTMGPRPHPSHTHAAPRLRTPAARDRADPRRLVPEPVR